MELILVFSSGRCGTAFLAQYFGGIFKDKHEWKIRDKFAVAHEPFDDLEEYWRAIKAIREGREVEIKEILIKKFAKIERCNKFLITDNKLARWFLRNFLNVRIELKVIYFYRSNEKALINSLKKSYQDTGFNWAYKNTDMHSLSDRSLDPFRYHIEETKAQWVEVKKKFYSKQYIEVSFESFLTNKNERERVEEFIGLTGFEKLLKKKVNISLPLLGVLKHVSPTQKMFNRIKILFKKIHLA